MPSAPTTSCGEPTRSGGARRNGRSTFRRLEMPDQLMKRFGWKPLTDDVKRRIFGLNAARVYRVNPEAKRNPMPSDYIEKLRRMYKQSGALTPSNTQYGWVPA